MKNTPPEALLEYWFGGPLEAEDYPADKAKLWFRGGEGVDRYIRENFSTLLQQAASGHLEAWRQSPRERLALVILLDQFSRNIYRDTAQAFEYDTQARNLTLEGIALKQDEALHPVEASFFYLPLQHAEDLTLQNLSLKCYQRLLDDALPGLVLPLNEILNYAKRHQKIIERFGRFPHRNALLGRTSTAEEQVFLKEANSSF